MLMIKSRGTKRQFVKDKITIAIVNPNTSICLKLAAWMRQTVGFRCAGVYATGEVAAEALACEKPHFVLMDVNLPGLNGIESVRRLKALLPQTHFLMFTNSQEADHVFGAFSAGATGYFLSETPIVALLERIRRIYSGDYLTKSEVARKIIEKSPFRCDQSNTEFFSKRQTEVLSLLVLGYTNQQIADALQLGIQSVCTHIRRIFRKLRVNSRAKAVAVYTQYNRLDFAKSKQP